MVAGFEIQLRSRWQEPWTTKQVFLEEQGRRNLGPRLTSAYKVPSYSDQEFQSFQKSGAPNMDPKYSDPLYKEPRMGSPQNVETLK